MAKTVKQLQAEYAAISEENRKAYDELHGSGTGVYSWQNRYDLLMGKSNLSDREKAELEALKPRYAKAAAAYKKTQEAKNALKKELQAAQKAETDKKEAGAKEKSAKSAYDQAKTEYDKAAAAQAAGGYKADEAYVAAYQALQTAAGEYQKAGGKPSALPTPRVTIPAPKGAESRTNEDGEQGTGITSYSDALKYLTDPANKESLIQAQKFLAKFGYKGNTKGEPDLTFTYALQKAAKEYANLPEAWRPGSLLDYISNPLNSGTGTGTGTGLGGTQISLYPTITNEEDGKATINKFFQDKLGRDATPEEFKTAYAAIKADQAKNPVKRVTKTDAKGNVVSTTTGGTNTEQFLTDYIAKNPKLQSELDTYNASDAKILQRKKDRKAYEKLVVAAGGDATKIADLANTTTYGKDIANVRRQIESQVIAAGANLTDEEINNLAKEAVDQALDTNIYQLKSFIDSKLKFGAGENGSYKGAAGEKVDALNKVAFDNGLTLEQVFDEKTLSKVLSAVNAGENINTYAKIIRNKAAEGKPKYVQDQLKLDKDLRTVYGSYLNAMAGAFNVDPETIDLNDPLLQKAITEKGSLKLNEFKNLLRSDARYGQTPAAASEADLRQQIADRAVSLGARVADSDIKSIVDKLMTTGAGSFGQSTIDAELRKFITYGGDKQVTGQAGNNLQALRETAAANGLDLDKTFGSSIQDWLQKIDQGESIDTYKRLIRSSAALGLPDNVKKMIDQGVDLATIYAPYKSLMSSILEINPTSIQLNDPTLRSAIGPDKEMSLYDFQRSLRKDNRWQYTDNARQEVSNGVKQVLQDFGFMG